MPRASSLLIAAIGLSCVSASVIKPAVGGALGRQGASLAQKASRAAHRRLDQDGDGSVSLEDMEGAVQRWWRPWARAAGRICSFIDRRRHLCLTVSGVLGLAWSNVLAHTIVFSHAFGSTGLPIVRGALERARESYERAKARSPRDPTAVAPLRQELRRLSRELATLSRRSRRTEGGP